MRSKPRLFAAGFLLCVSTLLLDGCTTSAPVTSFPLLHSRVVLTEVPFFPQRDYQCGPAALATVLAYRQVEITPDDLVSRIYLPGRHGTLAPEILAEVRRHEMLPYPLAPSMGDLLTEIAAGNPVLVMQNLGLTWYPQWHYAVVIGYDLDEQYLVLRSGVEAERKTTFHNFENTWRRADYWALVIPSREHLPVTANILTWLEGAQDLFATGHIVGSHEAYQLASARWPDDPLVWFVLGNSFYQRQQLSEAEAAYRHGLAIEKNAPETLNNLAYALLAQGCQLQAQQAAYCAWNHAPENRNIQQTLQEVANSRSFPKPIIDCQSVDC